VSWFKKILNQSSNTEAKLKYYSRQTTLSNPLIISSPKLGILNLLGKSGEALVSEDRLGLSSLFSSYVEGQCTPPSCDVLLLYCQIEKDGNVAGTKDSIREIIFKSKAPIVIVASPNSSDAYITATKNSAEGRANLVMVLDRKGTNFVFFYQKLFRLMQEGKTMPVAWVELAPQIPNEEHPNCPEAIFSCEAGHVTFK
jgi:hypothetical protein